MMAAATKTSSFKGGGTPTAPSDTVGAVWHSLTVGPRYRDEDSLRPGDPQLFAIVRVVNKTGVVDEMRPIGNLVVLATRSGLNWMQPVQAFDADGKPTTVR